MADQRKVFVTGLGAMCAAGSDPAAIWEAVRGGRSAVGPIRQWDARGWPKPLAGEVRDFDPRTLVKDRKTHKLICRRDFFGLYAATRAVEAAGFIARRETLPPAEAERFDERTGVYVGGGGGAYQDQYDFLPLLARSAGSLPRFGRDLTQTVNPMWLLRVLPNNVLCHIGITHGFKGPNVCVTNHSASGALAIVEAAAAVRDGTAERTIAVAHDAPIEPESVRYHDAVGLLTADAVRPFDARRSGCVLGEGAAALALESEDAARARGAAVLGEFVGSGCATEAEGLLAVRADGDGLAQAIDVALADAGVSPEDIGLIVAHGNGTKQGDASEAAAVRRVFGAQPPPMTAFKWAFGHTLAAAGMLDAVLALVALRQGEVPGVATLRELAGDCEGVAVSRATQRPRGALALVLSRGFAGINVAVVFRGALRGMWP